jgi:Fe-S oxidoreductase
MNIHSSDYAQATAGERLREAAQTDAETLVVPSCPICHSNFRSSVATGGRKVELKDLSDILDKVT